MLTRLELTNFRCFRHQVFDFTEGRTLILGDNDAGKSTLLDSVRYLMTGRCRGLDEGGKGVVVLVNDVDRVAGDSRTMSVGATIVRRNAGNPEAEDDQRTILRSFNGSTSSFTMSGTSGQSADQEAAFFAWLGAGLEQLRVILDGQLFADMAHADAKDLLMAFLPVEVADPLHPGQTLDPDEVDRLYQAAVVTRRDAKRDLSKVPEPVAPSQPLGDVEGVRTRLSELEGERSRLALQRAAEAGSSQATARGNLETHTRSVNDIKSQWQRALTRFQLDIDNVGELDAEIARQKALLQGAQDRQNRAVGVIEGLPAVTDEAGGFRAEQLEAHDPKKGCVLCESVPCKTPATAFSKQAKVYRDAEKATATARGEMGTARAALRAAEDECETFAARVTALTDARLLFAELEGQHDALKAALPALEAAVSVKDEPSELDNQIAVLDDRIKKGREVLAKKEAIAREHQAYTLASATRLELATKVQAAEAAVKAYGPGPDGVVSKAVAQVIGGFNERVNANLRHFGYTFSVSLDPWALVIDGRRWELLAESVRFRASIALQVAFAGIVGVDLTLIDRLDMLTAAHRRTTQQLVMSCGLAQVLLAKAEDAERPNPNIAGVQVIRL